MSEVREEGSGMLIGATILKIFKKCETEWNKHQFQASEFCVTISIYLHCAK